jgi:hypothetical protein
MPESVEIVLSAKNNASPVFSTVAKDLDARVKQIKATGEQTKKSVEFAGTFANALGGTQFGGFAQQLAQITEKTSQFAEVSKLGSSGALAFKAGLAGMVGVVALGIGKALGDVIYQTELWKKRLEEATKESDRLSAAIYKIKDASRATTLKGISLLPTEQQAGETKKILLQAEIDVDNYAKKLLKLRAEAESWGINWLIGGRSSGEIAQELKSAEQALQRQREIVEELRAPTTEVAKELKTREEQKRVDEIVKSERERLEIMREQVTKGDDAAKALELQKRGVDAITAKALAAEEAFLKLSPEEDVEEDEPLFKTKAQKEPELQGLFSRLLTRGPAKDPVVDAINALPKAIGESIGEQLARRDNANEPALRVKVVP